MRGDLDEHAYSNFNRLIYKIALGVSTTQLKQSRGIKHSENLTQYLTADEANAVQRVKGQVITLLELNMDYQMIKQIIARQGIIYQVTLPTRQEAVTHE